MSLLLDHFPLNHPFSAFRVAQLGFTRHIPYWMPMHSKAIANQAAVVFLSLPRIICFDVFPSACPRQDLLCLLTKTHATCFLDEKPLGQRMVWMLGFLFEMHSSMSCKSLLRSSNHSPSSVATRESSPLQGVDDGSTCPMAKHDEHILVYKQMVDLYWASLWKHQISFLTRSLSEVWELGHWIQ